MEVAWSNRDDGSGRRREGLRRVEQRRALRSATGACAREGRASTGEAIAPDAGSAPIEACRKADGLRFVLDVT